MDEYLSNKSVNVRWRIDNDEAQTGIWDVSTKGTSIFVKSEFKNKLGRDIRSGSNILLEVTDYRGTNHRVKFSLKGSSKTISAVYKACDIPMKKITFDGVSDVTSNYIDRMGPKSTACFKKQLILSNYQITNISKTKTEELYQHAQMFLNKKMKQCPSDGDFLLERSCKDPEEFFFRSCIKSLPVKIPQSGRNVVH